MEGPIDDDGDGDDNDRDSDYDNDGERENDNNDVDNDKKNSVSDVCNLDELGDDNDDEMILMAK